MGQLLNVELYKNRINSWWVPMVSGILFIILGFVIFFNPAQSYIALSLVFGIFVMFVGFMELFVGTASTKGTGRGWLMASGVIEIMLGIFLLLMPVASAAILPYLLAFWLLFKGFTTIGVSSDMMDYGIKGSGWVLFLAIMLVIFALLIMFHPIIGIGAIVIYIGASFIIAGVAFIAYSLLLKDMKKHLKSIKGKVEQFLSE